ncbi:acetate/propionate family kinase [Camelimonas lactis]|uniref:Acetate kinase n=1 Tax=Camelimonas lactis TaxID=659006 RepID=A0A4R2GP74_9HYPH|nr:acetate/propionate family kinase [Camelimonas lactis]TCO11204.1 acetate kinase [Camelimonas lactis]
MDGKLLVTFNAGSSTVKIGLFALDAGADGLRPRRIGKGMIDFRRAPLRFELTEGPDHFDIELAAPAGEELDEVLSEAFSRLSWHFDLDALAAVGHRVVHGAGLFTAPVVIDAAALARIDSLTPLAPLHQPQALKLVRAIARLRPGLRQTASFDTAFHATNADLTRRFALPRALHDAGVRRYGFHGLSYAFIAGELTRRRPDVAAGRVVAAHLGSGASLCVMENGLSRDSSMSFSTLDGVPMATRCGALDPGALLYLLGQKGQGLPQVEDLLYHRSGLLGVSGISADSRDLLASDRAEAREALELFALRVAGEAARLATTAGGVDALVFTAGIGEHQPQMRAMICERLAWLGVRLDVEKNAANAFDIASADSQRGVFVLATDEEQVIAREAVAALAGAGSPSPEWNGPAP